MFQEQIEQSEGGIVTFLVLKRAFAHLGVIEDGASTARRQVDSDGAIARLYHIDASVVEAERVCNLFARKRRARTHAQVFEQGSRLDVALAIRTSGSHGTVGFASAVRTIEAFVGHEDGSWIWVGHGAFHLNGDLLAATWTG